MRRRMSRLWGWVEGVVAMVPRLLDPTPDEDAEKDVEVVIDELPGMEDGGDDVDGGVSPFNSMLIGVIRTAYEKFSPPATLLRFA